MSGTCFLFKDISNFLHEMKSYHLVSVHTWTFALLGSIGMHLAALWTGVVAVTMSMQYSLPAAGPVLSVVWG